MIPSLFITLFLASFVVTVSSQEVPLVSTVNDLDGSTCIVHTNCSLCIQSSPNCAWCEQEGYDKTTNAPRCDLVSNLQSRGCPFTSIVNPRSQIISVQNSSLDSRVQMAPQRIHLKLRPRQAFQIDVYFRQAEDYPVDLYYLMDLSHSMADDQANLGRLGTHLAEEMRKLTKNFRLGFGSFVDKVVMPYVSTVPKKLQEPCHQCAAPYGYKHHMTLSEQDDEFVRKVLEAKISGNLDAPEGGFDAVMQAVACKSEIGWREKARKLLVLSTDASFHYAGDGKLGGIVTPNDGQCHLAPRDGLLHYTESDNQDYPSLSQINRAVKENKINMIFAVTEDQYPIYERLSNHVEGSSAGTLAGDSSNVVQLVKNQYNKITSAIELKDNANKEYLSVTYWSSCLGTRRERTNICSGLKVGSEVKWEVMVEVHKCPPGKATASLPFRIYPVGLDDYVDVQLEVQCGCDCEQTPVRHSILCGGVGDLVCGICTCPPGFYGRFCECSATGISLEDLNAKCIHNATGLECAGRGQCVCGQCQCYPRAQEDQKVYGEFCECDNFSCDYSNGQLCGGAEQGTCDCGRCKCKPGWTGPDCSCSLSVDTCMAKNGKICNGHGRCECGRCVCDPEANGTSLYYGPTCENCPTCPGMCYTLKPCAQCQAFGTGELGDEQDDGAACRRNCTLFNATHVEELYDDMPGEKICQFRDERDFCTFFFSYYDHPDTGKLMVEVKKTKVCPEEVRALPIIIGVIAGILGVGVVLLLIWKLITLIHDRRQLAKFNAEVQQAKWDTSGNPIFRPATNTYKNPVYGNK